MVTNKLKIMCTNEKDKLQDLSDRFVSFIEEGAQPWAVEYILMAEVMSAGLLIQFVRAGDPQAVGVPGGANAQEQ